MVEFEFLGNGAEETGIWDDRDLPLDNMDLLQKVDWHVGPDGKMIIEMDGAVAKLLTRKNPPLQSEETNPFDPSKRFST
ncbi:MAG: hypothetical protein ACJ8FY_04580 [Gemmataceae bacterium]